MINFLKKTVYKIKKILENINIFVALVFIILLFFGSTELFFPYCLCECDKDLSREDINSNWSISAQSLLTVGLFFLFFSFFSFFSCKSHFQRFIFKIKIICLNNCYFSGYGIANNC